MTECAREVGVYSQGHAAPVSTPAPPTRGALGLPAKHGPAPGECFPWEVKRAELPAIEGDEALVRRVWQEIDALGAMYVWQVLLSF